MVCGANGVGSGGNAKPDVGNGIAYNTWAQATATGHFVSGSYYYGGGGGGGWTGGPAGNGGSGIVIIRYPI